MRKGLIVGAMLLFFTTSVFCQYRDTYWGEKSSDVAMSKRHLTRMYLGDYFTLYEPAYIMQQSAGFYYVFDSYSELKYIGYTLSLKPGLKEQLDDKMISAGYLLEHSGGDMLIGGGKLYEELMAEYDKSIDEDNPVFLAIEDYEIAYAGGDSILQDSRKEEKINIVEDEIPEGEERHVFCLGASEWTYGADTRVIVFYWVDKVIVLYTKDLENNF